MKLVEVKDLRKEYPVRYGFSGTKQIVAVEKLNFDISKGEVFGLLGPNGAGKSTTIKMISTLVTPTSGDATIDGSSVVSEPEKVREKIGVMLAGERTMYWKLTGRENLQYFSTLYHMNPGEAKHRIDYLLKLVGLSDHEKARVEGYSTGMRIRLSFAKSLLNDAPVLLLDEPTMSLDPQAARVVRETVLSLRDQGKSILLTTHNMDEADRLSDRVGIIDHGNLIAIGSSSQLKREYTEKITLRIKMRNTSGVEEALSKLKGIEAVRIVPDSTLQSEVEITCATDQSQEIVSSVLRTLANSNMNVESFNIVEPTLEDVFIRLTGRTLRD
jgi:ABC-2 type transport system ATP-binding protein